MQNMKRDNEDIDEGKKKKNKKSDDDESDDEESDEESDDECDEESNEESESEEEEDRKICQETLEDTVVGYAFTVTLESHDEWESVVMIRVSITHEKELVGHLNGLVIDRDFRPRSQFHELCDSQSQELQGMGVCFCNDDGTLRYKTLNGLAKEKDDAASSGGFLQIENVSIDEAHRHKDLGIRCVKTLLEWLNVRDARERQERQQAAQLEFRNMRDTLKSEHVAGGDLWARYPKPEFRFLHAG